MEIIVGCLYGARAVQKEIVKAGRSSNVHVYFVWLPMLPGDNENEDRSIDTSN